MLSYKILKRTRQQSIWNKWGTYIWKENHIKWILHVLRDDWQKVTKYVARTNESNLETSRTLNVGSYTEPKTVHSYSFTVYSYQYEKYFLPKVNSETEKEAYSFQGAKLFNKPRLEMMTETSICDSRLSVIILTSTFNI